LIDAVPGLREHMGREEARCRQAVRMWLAGPFSPVFRFVMYPFVYAAFEDVPVRVRSFESLLWQHPDGSQCWAAIEVGDKSRRPYCFGPIMGEEKTNG